ncbi:MAG: DEAD/DEAH box helicase [Thermodesulfobacteriota bacterium]
MKFIERLKASPDLGPLVAWHEVISARPAQWGDLSRPLPAALQAVLTKMGITRLYRHQTQALNLARDGRHVLTATPTASGKSLIYHLPVFETALNDPETRALYLFPLKALEQDQLKSIREMDSLLGLGRIRSCVYDGDTSPHLRKKIRENPPNIVITNPDMLHLSFLAYHDSWEQFWRNLGYVVIDEVHTYRGVFGGHVAQVIRRLRRIVEHYGRRPTFILSSATIGNPAQLARALTGLECETITESGAPAAGKHFVFVNPEANTAVTAARIFVRAIKDGLRTIAFTQSRRLTELMHRWAWQMAPHHHAKISSYRAGFLPEERRDIEKKLNTGEMLGVISTSALELGLDIGHLELCLLVGYPGSIINTWQRGGRVGRADRESGVILLAQPDALDQYFMRHPEDFFGRGFEPAVLDPDNEPILADHLTCAAAELPLAAEDGLFRPQDRPDLMRDLCRRGLLLLDDLGRTYHSARRRPHRDVDLRGTGESYAIIEESSGTVIGAVDGVRALKECHPGAVYLHRADTWVVTRLDLERTNAYVRREDVNYYTRPKTEKETEILETLAVKPVANFLAKLGRLRVREKVVGYEKRLMRGQELMGVYNLDLPETVFETVGLWFEFEDFVPAALDPTQHYMGGIHAVEHAAIGLFPLVALCDRNDVGGISYPRHPELGKGAVFIYDGYPGGVGLAKAGFDALEDLLTRTLATIDTCECEVGCPSCIYSPKCGSGNKPLDKAAAVRVLEVLLGKRALAEKVGSIEPEEEPEPPAGNKSKPVRKRILAFDVETKRSAAEVGGWDKAHLMGLAAGVVYDSLEDKYYVYGDEETAALVDRLLGADLIIGFNQMRFDFQVLTAYTVKDLRGRPNLDLCLEVHKALGRRLSLDHLGLYTLNRKKTADGLQSLRWVKEGRLDLVKDYCREDVRLTWDLYAFARDNGYLVYQDKSGRRLRLPLNLDLKNFIQDRI